jgi:hypothetical protein
MSPQDENKKKTWLPIFTTLLVITGLIAAAAWYFHENPESSDAGKSLASKLTEK